MQVNISAVKIVSVLLLALTVLASLASSANSTEIAQSSAPPQIGIIKNPGKFLEECGCALRFPADKNNRSRCIFLSDLDDNARMNIDGQDIKLSFAGRVSDKNQRRIGSRSTESWDAGDVIVKIDYVITRLSSEDYEANDYIASIKATRGKASRTIKTAGYCGC